MIPRFSLASAFLALLCFAPLSRASLLRNVCFPRLSSIMRDVDPDSQRGAFELVAAALNGEAALPRQTRAAARPAHGGGGVIVRLDVAIICSRGPGTGVTLGSAQTRPGAAQTRQGTLGSLDSPLVNYTIKCNSKGK